MNGILRPVDNPGHIWAHLHIQHYIMGGGNNIHVQQRKTNMINAEWSETQNDAPFVAFYDMHAVNFYSARWNGKCVDRGTAVVYFYTPIKPHGVSQANWFPFHTLFTSRKNIGFGTRTTQPAAILRITRKAAIRLWF